MKCTESLKGWKSSRSDSQFCYKCGSPLMPVIKETTPGHYSSRDGKCVEPIRVLFSECSKGCPLGNPDSFYWKHNKWNSFQAGVTDGLF